MKKALFLFGVLLLTVPSLAFPTTFNFTLQGQNYTADESSGLYYDPYFQDYYQSTPGAYVFEQQYVNGQFFIDVQLYFSTNYVSYSMFINNRTDVQQTFSLSSPLDVTIPATGSTTVFAWLGVGYICDCLQALQTTQMGADSSSLVQIGSSLLVNTDDGPMSDSSATVLGTGTWNLLKLDLEGTIDPNDIFRVSGGAAIAPEPEVLTLLGLGLVGLVLIRCFERVKQSAE